MEKTAVRKPKEEDPKSPWGKLKNYVVDHQMLLLDQNLATKEMQFKDGEIIIDGVHYSLTNLGWGSMCARMAPVGDRKPPAHYIRHLPKNLQNQLMTFHFGEIPNLRHFIRAKASDDGPFIRAMLSETYQRGRFDNFDFMKIMLGKFRETMPGFHPVGWHMGERIFHVKTLSDAFIQDPVKATLKIGVMFSDSEVGAGSVVIRPFVRREGTYTDLFILGDCFRRKHTGARKYKDVKGNLVILDSDALKKGVQTDKLRITKDIHAYIDKMLADKDKTKEETEKVILRFYETEIPIKSWDEDDLITFFDWLWKRIPSTIALSKGTVREAVFKLPDYDMKNIWGLFNALCEVSQNTSSEQQLEYEVQAARLASHLYSLLR